MPGALVTIHLGILFHKYLPLSRQTEKKPSGDTGGLSWLYIDFNPGASSLGNLSPQLHTASLEPIYLHLLQNPCSISVRISSDKKQTCCQIVVYAGYLLSALALRTLLKRYPVLTGFQRFVVFCDPLPRHRCPSSFQYCDDP